MKPISLAISATNGRIPQPGYDRPSATRDGRKVQYGEYPETVGTELNETGIGAHWASAANTPWRFWKAEAYQGGIHAPFMMSWPARKNGASGRMIADAAHIIDVTPTLLELAGVPSDGKRPPFDGKSLAGVLTGKPLPGPRPFFFEHYGARAVIDGSWKLVSLAPGRVQQYLPWALYDLRNDRTETNDLAGRYPDRVRRMEAQWLSWVSSVRLKIPAH
jgi:arylsulfatase A-like enzyme